jgi:hypothetical protein
MSAVCGVEWEEVIPRGGWEAGGAWASQAVLLFLGTCGMFPGTKMEQQQVPAW